MATCPNCKKSLSCGCQQRKAKDGTTVCTNCLAGYNSKIAPTIAPSPKPVTNPNVWGFDRYKK